MDLRVLRIARGILIGMLVDLFCSFIYSILLGVVLAIWLSYGGVDNYDLPVAISQTALTAPWLFISGLGGAAISLAAGFVAANIIRYNYGNYLGLMGTALALISLNGTAGYLSLNTSIFFALLTLVAILGGGWLYGWATGSADPTDSSDSQED